MKEPAMLKDKVAVVTGGSQGIGRVIALTLATAGADLVLASRSREALEATRAEIETLGRKALVVPTDVRREESVQSLEEQTLAYFGHVDIPVNNAAHPATFADIRHTFKQHEDPITR